MNKLLPDLSDSIQAAKDLLGWKLVHESPQGRTSGFIVETEAYEMSDPASHAFGGERIRNAPMFQQAGTIYVYFTYGMHYCMNIVTGQRGNGQAVLIRALEPAEGVELMKVRRGIGVESQLTNGPAKLVKAMGISKHANGTRLGKRIRLEPGIDSKTIVQTTRVGISKSKELEHRFYIANNPFVSKT